MINKKLVTIILATSLMFNTSVVEGEKHVLLGNTNKVKTTQLTGDAPETIYDLYSKEEIEVFQKCVEAETYTQSLDEKVNVANVIYNRVLSDSFPDTFYDVIYQKTGSSYQFSCVYDGTINKREISDDTVRACEMVFEQDDTTDGALFYLNKKYSSSQNIRWFERNLEFLFTDASNHSFYK